MVVKAPEERLGYLEVRDHLLARIARGEIPIHSRMPTIQQTSRDLGVSYVTAQRAYRTLAEQGVVRSGRGQPATVIAKAPQRFVKPLVVGGIFRAAKALNPRDNYGAEMTEAILRTLAENGVSVLYRHLDDAGFEEAFLSDVASGRLGGVLGDELTPDALLQSAVALGLPVVAFNRTRAPGGVTCVCPDHEWNGRFTARKVMELGYGRVVVCKTSRADLRSAEKDRIRAQSIDAYVGAVAGELARLGMADAMISRIPEEAAVPRDPWFDPDWVRPWLEPLAR
ncbi:MAG TPA: GntR family transcriptional regulator, partial [Candidatus Brocadiia bacterium]|nr:GntR family transcriptional regulator [Candidatus Brocadiia bacterium]